MSSQYGYFNINDAKLGKPISVYKTVDDKIVTVTQVSTTKIEKNTPGVTYVGELKEKIN